VGVDDHSTFGDGLEEIILGQTSGLREVKKFESLEQESVHADFGGCLELYLVEQFSLKARLGGEYATIGCAISLF
jgi:hypothetical protein